MRMKEEVVVSVNRRDVEEEDEVQTGGQFCVLSLHDYIGRISEGSVIDGEHISRNT